MIERVPLQRDTLVPRREQSGYFDRDEFACQYTGNNEIEDKFIEKLDKLREACGFPFVITSGFRDKTHPGFHHLLPMSVTHGLAAELFHERQ